MSLVYFKNIHICKLGGPVWSKRDVVILNENDKKAQSGL